LNEWVFPQADFWVATTADGPEHAISPWVQLQTRYADATGHAPVYPEWTSGFWQSKNRYHNQSQVLDVARGYGQRGLPLALMIIDYFSW
jgi:alpha-D-xyloside xylohydrolase